MDIQLDGQINECIENRLIQLPIFYQAAINDATSIPIIQYK